MENEVQNYKKESHLDGYPDSLSPEQMEQALFQMKNCICKIKLEKGIIGTGFFCKIPSVNKFELIPVLITCNHVLKENNIKEGKIINFSLDNEKYPYSILITSSRRTYTDEKKDITIIEIKPNEDNIKFESFLDIDPNIYRDNINESYHNKSIYIIHYEYGKNYKYSIGIIRSIGEDKYTINHVCSTETGSSWSPIINLSNYNVIGVHKGNKKLNKLNVGTLIKYPIEEFNELHKNLKLKVKNIEEKEDFKTKGINNISKSKISDYNIDLKKFNNIIYYNENLENLNCQECYDLEKITNGAFILCTNIESFELIKEEIVKIIQKEDKRIVFNLITTGSKLEYMLNFLGIEKCFKNIFIYCKNTNIYYQFKNKYNIIYDISNNIKDAINFILNSSSKGIKPYTLVKIITYEEYLDNHKDIHFEISKFYGDLTPESFSENINKMEYLLNENDKEGRFSGNVEKYISGFFKFNINNDLDELNKEIIREYSSDTIYRPLNFFLQNSKTNINASVAYFISRLMYSLNSVALKYQLYEKRNNEIFYRGVKMRYTNLLSYLRAKGKIITFSYILSTSPVKRIAELFSGRESPLNYYRNRLTFSIIFVIKNIMKTNLISNAINVTEYSEYSEEKEILFLPYSFFYVKDVKIDIKSFTADIYLETIGRTEILEEQIKKGKQIFYNEKEKIMQIKN